MKSSAANAGAPPDPWGRRTAMLLAAVTAFRLLIISTTEVANGEAYYALWARFPAWSYYDHPPFIAWLEWIATRFSQSSFALRSVPVVCALAFGALTYRLGRRLFSARAAFIAVALVCALPAFFVTSFVVNPEAPLAPLWVLALLCLEAMRESDSAWRPLALGAAIGLAFLAKYTGVLLVPVALGYLAASPGMRRWLKRPSLYLGGLVALGVALPVLLWNAYQGWPTLTLHLVERNAPVDAGTMLHNGLNVFIGQATAYNPLLFAGLMFALVVAVRRARTDERYRFVTWTSAPVLAFIFIAMSRVRDPEAHWTMTAFVPVALAAGGWLDERFQRGPVGGLLKNYLRVGAAMSAAVALIGYVHFRTDWLLHIIPASSYDPNHDASTELVGWQQVREAIQAHAERLGGDTVVASCQYALCAQILRQLDDRPEVFCPSVRRTEFDFIGRRDPPPQANVLFVNDDHYPDDPALSLPQRECRLLETVPVERAHRTVRNYRLFSCPPERGGAPLVLR